jgi:hypothetical protein
MTRARGETDAAMDLLVATAAEYEGRDAGVVARARIELEYVRVNREGKTLDDLLEATAHGIRTFEATGDHRALGRAWLLSGWARGGHRGDHKAWMKSAECALTCYREAGWPASTCLGELAAALYWGPTPVNQARTRCERLLATVTTDLPGAAYLRVFLGGFAAQQGAFDRARSLLASASKVLEDLGIRSARTTYCAPVLADVELLSGNASGATQILRQLCEQLVGTRDFSTLASRASNLAEALVAQELFDEAEAWTKTAEEHAATDDVKAQMMWRPIRAIVHAHRGEFASARTLVGEGLALANSTDDLNRRARTYRDLGHVLRSGGRSVDAALAFERAAELFQQKGNIVEAKNVLAYQDELIPV